MKVKRSKVGGHNASQRSRGHKASWRSRGLRSEVTIPHNATTHLFLGLFTIRIALCGSLYEGRDSVSCYVSKMDFTADKDKTAGAGKLFVSALCSVLCNLSEQFNKFICIPLVCKCSLLCFNRTISSGFVTFVYIYKNCCDRDWRCVWFDYYWPFDLTTTDRVFDTVDQLTETSRTLCVCVCVCARVADGGGSRKQDT